MQRRITDQKKALHPWLTYMGSPGISNAILPSHRGTETVTIPIMAKNFKELSEREILALAISLEEEDSRIYGDFADGLRNDYPASAQVFEAMQAEESQHRASLLALYEQRFGPHIPLIRRQDVKGFVQRRPVW